MIEVNDGLTMLGTCGAITPVWLCSQHEICMYVCMFKLKSEKVTMFKYNDN